MVFFVADLFERHLVVIGGNSVNLLAGSQPVFHDRLALLALPVAGLFTGDVDVGEPFLDDLLNPIDTAVGRFIAQLTDQDGQVALTAPIALPAPLLFEGQLLKVSLRRPASGPGRRSPFSMSSTPLEVRFLRQRMSLF